MLSMLWHRNTLQSIAIWTVVSLFASFSSAQAVQGHDFTPPWDPSNGCFFHFSLPWGFPRLGNFKDPTTTTLRKNCPNNTLRRCPRIFMTTKITQIPCFFNVSACFCNGFLQNTKMYTFVVTKLFRNIMFYMFPSGLSLQTLENSAIYSVFFNFALSNAAGQLEHIYKKSF